MPGVVQCRATSNLSAVPILLGIDPRQIAAQRDSLLSSAKWQQCFENHCFPTPQGVPNCTKVVVPCDGAADELIVDDLSLGRLLAAHREAAVSGLRMLLYRSLSPFAMGTSPVWVLVGSLLATFIAAVAQAGLGAVIFRSIYGRYYSWRSCLAGVHGASVAISWGYTLLGGVGVAMIHIFMSSISFSPIESSVGSPSAMSLWQWGPAATTDAELQSRCDPIAAVCGGLLRRAGVDDRLAEACLACLDYFAAGNASASDGVFIDSPSLNMLPTDSEWFGIVALVVGAGLFLVAAPIAAFLAVHWYAAPRRFFGIPFEADGRDGMPSLCCCCRPFLFFLRGICIAPLSQRTMEQYDADEADAERFEGVERLSVDDGEDEGEAFENDSPKMYGCWPSFWPRRSSQGPRHYFARPYYVGAQSDSEAEAEEEMAQQSRSAALHQDYIGEGSDWGVFSFLRAESPFRRKASRLARRSARRFYRLVACRGFVGPIAVRRLWGPAVSRYRLPSAVWSTMPLWSGLVLELACLLASPGVAASLDDVFGASSFNSSLCCSLVLYSAASAHFVLAAWLLSGVWKQPLRSPFLNWCTGVAWLITGLHLLTHGMAAGAFIDHVPPEGAVEGQFADWDGRALPTLLADAIVTGVCQNSTSALMLRGYISAASRSLPGASSIAVDAVPADMVACLAGAVMAEVLSAKKAPLYRTQEGAIVHMAPSAGGTYWCSQQPVVDAAAPMVDDAALLYLMAVAEDVAKAAPMIEELASRNAPLYADNCDVVGCSEVRSPPTGSIPSAGDVPLSDLLSTPRGHIWLSTFFLLLAAAVNGIRIASAFLFLISDTFVVITASGAVKRQRGAQRQTQLGCDNNGVLPDPMANTASGLALDYHYYFYKDESLLLPSPNDDVSARAMDNEEVFSEMGWAVAAGVPMACVAMYDVYRERFGLTDLDTIDDGGALEGVVEAAAGGEAARRGAHRLLRFHIAKARGLLPPPAQWEVFANPNRPSLPCCGGSAVSRAEMAKRRRRGDAKERREEAAAENERLRARSVAYANLAKSGLADDASAFAFEELLMVGESDEDDEDDDTLDRGHRAEDFAQRRKRAASRMFIAMAAGGAAGEASSPDGSAARQRQRSATVMMSSGGMHAATSRDAGGDSDSDGIESAVLAALARHDAAKEAKAKDAAAASIVMGEGMRRGAGAAAPGGTMARRFTMFSPSDERNAKSVSAYEKARRKQSVFASVDVEELDIEVPRHEPPPTATKRTASVRRPTASAAALSPTFAVDVGAADSLPSFSPRPPPPPVARRLGGARTGRPYRRSAAPAQEMADVAPTEAAVRPSARKAKARTRSEFIREVEADEEV